MHAAIHMHTGFTSHIREFTFGHLRYTGSA